ncbi:MAG: polysaccharide biosynthesis C-terminal domain-containing protein [Ruminococcus sp.]|nr:polysaccharide biosynthesis C-terminal domain-containing protein [Ruminococcus sp.]
MKKQNFLKGSIILMLSAIIAKALGAFFKIPLTNILGGVGMSYFSSAYSLFMPLYALTTTGLSSAVARMTAQSSAFGMYKNIKKIRRTAHIIFSLAGLAGSFVIFFLAKPFIKYSAGNTDGYLAAAMISPAVLFGCITAVERGYYEGMSNMYPTALSQAVEGIVKVTAGLWLCGYVSGNSGYFLSVFPDIKDIRALSAAAGILGVTLSSLGAVVFFMVLSFFRTKIPENQEEKVLTFSEISSALVKNALPTGISAVVTNLTALIDMWTVIGCISKYSHNNIPVGISEQEFPQFVYGSFAGIALTVFNLVPSVTNMLGKGILPVITHAWENKDKKALNSGTSQALFTALFIAVPSAFGITVLSEHILNFLFSRQADEAFVCVMPLKILMLGMVFLCLSFPVFSMLQAIGKAAVPMKIMLVGTAVKLVGNLALIPLTGINGAAWSTSLCYAVIFTISIFIYFRHADIHLETAPFISVLYSGLMCGGAAWLAEDISSRNNASPLLTIAVSTISGGIFYIISILLSNGKFLKIKTFAENQ